MNTQTISLDVSKAAATLQEIAIRQGDHNGTTLNIGVFDNGVALTLTGYDVRLCIKLPDREHYYSVVGTASGNTATYLIDEAYAGAYPGITEIAYAEVYDGDELICSTQSFRVVVEPDARAGVDPGEQYISEIEELEQRCEDIIGIIETEGIPTMSADTKGGAKLGSGLAMDSNQVLSVDVTPGDIGAYTKTETDEAIAASAARAYKAAGSVTFANLPRILTESMLGYVYNVEDGFTIDASVQSIFVEQSGTFPAGTNVVVVETGTAPSIVYKYDVVSGFVDLSNYLQKTHVDAGTDVTSGTLGVARGGTGAGTHTENAVLAGNGTSALKEIATASGALYATGANAAPQFGALPIAQGGTGAVTADAARQGLNASRAWYATCDTAAATAAKVATCTGFVLEAGAMVCCRFANENTAASPTLNVNGTGAKDIYANNSQTAANVYWVAGETVTLVYDGTVFRMADSVGLNALRESVNQIGDEKSGSWKVSSSSAINIELTDKLTLEPGTWIVIACIPLCSANVLASLVVNNTEIGDVYVLGGSYGGTLSTIIKTSIGAQVWLKSASSGSSSFSNTHLGWIKAVRIK